MKRLLKLLYVVPVTILAIAIAVVASVLMLAAEPFKRLSLGMLVHASRVAGVPAAVEFADPVVVKAAAKVRKFK